MLTGSAAVRSTRVYRCIESSRRARLLSTGRPRAASGERPAHDPERSATGDGRVPSPRLVFGRGQPPGWPNSHRTRCTPDAAGQVASSGTSGINLGPELKLSRAMQDTEETRDHDHQETNSAGRRDIGDD
jgi:hypothetical protein